MSFTYYGAIVVPAKTAKAALKLAEAVDRKLQAASYVQYPWMYPGGGVYDVKSLENPEAQEYLAEAFRATRQDRKEALHQVSGQIKKPHRLENQRLQAMMARASRTLGWPTRVYDERGEGYWDPMLFEEYLAWERKEKPTARWWVVYTENAVV